MTQRIQALFKKEKAYVGYLTVGDGGRDTSLQAALALIKGGVNLLELGLPFSDPIADGPVIQRASERALSQGFKLKDMLWLIEKIRQHSEIPLILFSYLNPILASLKFNFLQQAKELGLDALLIVDSPFEESAPLRTLCQQKGLDLIAVLTPSTDSARLKLIAEHSSGFLYYACRKGTTGIKENLPLDFKEQIEQIKAVSSLPVVAGFGISNSEMFQSVLNQADGVVVGSLFVKAIEDKLSMRELSALAQSLRNGVSLVL